MSFRLRLFLVLLTCISACKAENANEHPAETKRLPVKNSTFIDYVPTGWILQDQRIVDIDINSDGVKDAILTLIEDQRLQKGDNPDPSIEERALLVLLGDKNGKYRRSSFAKNVLLCALCAGMMGTFSDKESGEMLYADGVLTIGWTAGSRDTVDADLSFGFNTKLGQFVLLSDKLEKRDRVEGRSKLIKRDFVAGTQNLDGKVSKIDKKVISIEAVKYSDYLEYK